MSIVKNLRIIGNSVGIPIPSEVFDILEIPYKSVKFYFRSDDSGHIFVSFLSMGVSKFDERKLSKRGSQYCVVLPKPLVQLWDISIGDPIEISLNRKNIRELQLKPL